MKVFKFLTILAVLFVFSKGTTVNGQAKNDNYDKISVWHWASNYYYYGINHVVIDPVKADFVIESYVSYKVNRVYGGYLRTATTHKDMFRTWNRKLHQKGIKSIYLIGTPQWTYPEYRKDLLALINDNYISYNQSVNADEKLDGIHLDIEPHALKEWAKASRERRLELLMMLKDTYAAVRNELKANGMGNDEIMVDFPFWFEHSDAIAWQSEEHKKKWFDDLSTIINGISIMNYENSNIAIIKERVEWEKNNFKGVVEIGLNYEEIGTTYKDINDFAKVMKEIQRSTDLPIAIHRFTYMMYDYLKVLEGKINNPYD